MVEQHVSDDDIQEYLDNALSVAERARIEAHLNVCDHCTDIARSLGSIDAALRRIPLERPEARFTSRIMEGIVGSSSSAFRLLEYTAYFFGLLIVGAISLTAFVVLGNGNQGSSADTGISVAMSSLSARTDMVFRGMKELIPQTMNAPAFKFMFMVVLSIGFLVVLDRLLWRWLGHRS